MRTKQSREHTPTNVLFESAYMTPELAANIPRHGHPHHQSAPRLTSPQLSQPTSTRTHKTLPAASSSPYLSSPPPLLHSRSPYANVPLPPILPYEEGDPILNSILGRGPTLSTNEWDIRTSPSIISRAPHPLSRPRRSSSMRPGPGEWRSEPASTPCLSSIVIRTTAVAQRPIVVFPSDTGYPFITVYDVLDAVHRAVKSAHVELDAEQSPSLIGRTLESAWMSSRDDGRLTDRHLADRDSASVARDPVGWRWGGLTPSPTEGDVWILLLF